MTHHFFLTINLLPPFLARSFSRIQGLTTANKYPAPLFSEELFSDTRLNQVNQFVQFTKSIKMEQDMQNKPNLRNAQINISSVPTETYGELSLRRHPQNKPKQTQFKPKTKPIPASQPPFKTKTNPILPAIALAKAGKANFKLFAGGCHTKKIMFCNRWKWGILSNTAVCGGSRKRGSRVDICVNQ
jgi:hypothetical protein